jgi:hypothetical protein
MHAAFGILCAAGCHHDQVAPLPTQWKYGLLLCCVKVFDSACRTIPFRGRSYCSTRQTGDYQFCCGTTKVTGTGRVTKKANLVTVEDSTSGRRVLSSSMAAPKRALRAPQLPPGKCCTIADRNIANNTAGVQLTQHATSWGRQLGRPAR